MRRVILCALVCLSSISMPSCRSAPLQTPPPILLQEPRGDMREAILRAMVHRGWRPLAEEPGKITAQVIVRGKHKAVVDILYTDRKVEFEYVSSENLDYEVYDGQPMIHGNYNAWVGNLRDDIDAELILTKPIGA